LQINIKTTVSDNQLDEEIKKPAQALELEPAPPPHTTSSIVSLAELIPAPADNSYENNQAAQ
jgi:hypothetical protein